MSVDVQIPGHVVVIDDHHEQAEPLLKIFNKKGIPTTYFDGDPHNLPENSMEGVRLIILDLVLVSSQPSEKNICSTIAQYLKKIVSKFNGPYFLLIWSKHEDPYLPAVLKLFSNELKEIAPIAHATLQKAEYFETVDESGGQKVKDRALESIAAEIKAALIDKGAFHYLLLWEKSIYKAAQGMLSEFSLHGEADVSWDTNFANILLNLAEADVGDQLDKSKPRDVLDKAHSALNGILADSISQYMDAAAISETKLAFSDNLPRKIKAKLNTSFILNPKIRDIMPGVVFLERAKRTLSESDRLQIDDILKKEVIKKATLRKEIHGATKFVHVEVSPACDWANKKMRKHRFLRGILLKAEHAKHVKLAGFLCSSPLFYW